MNQPQAYICPLSLEPPSHLPPLLAPLGCYRASFEFLESYWKLPLALYLTNSSIYVGASLIAQLVKNLPVMQETLVQFLGQKICWRRDRLLTPVFLGFPCGSAGKESACNVGGLGSIPGLGRSLEKGYVSMLLSPFIPPSPSSSPPLSISLFLMSCSRKFNLSRLTTEKPLEKLLQWLK